MSNPTIEHDRTRLIQAELELAGLLATLGSNHNRTRAAHYEVERLTQRLKDEQDEQNEH